MSPTPILDVDAPERLSQALGGLDLRWCRALARAGVRDVADMVGWTLDDVRDVQKVGPVGRAAIVAALQGAGFTVTAGARVPR